jgi:nicotinamide-nucleotide amidase
MFPLDLLEDAVRTLDLLRRRRWMLAAAESCTGGLLAALLTEIPGSSDVLERGFVTYSNRAKAECVGVDPDLIARFGAVSTEVAQAMARGALTHSVADIAVAVTGVAGPGGGSAEKPVGLVHFAAATRQGETSAIERRYGDIGRTAIRIESVRTALSLVRLLAGK